MLQAPAAHLTTFSERFLPFLPADVAQIEMDHPSLTLIAAVLLHQPAEARLG